MKSFLLPAVLGLLFGSQVLAQDPKPSDTSAKAARAQAAAEQPKLSTEELEAKFKAMLAEATLTGRWASTKGGTLGPEKEDKYTIAGVNKLSGDTWVVNARMQYGQREFVAPIPVLVKWAGDTAVIIVDKLQVPGGGTYSARVLIHEHTYAGTWSGGEQGGLLYGIISNQSTPKHSGAP
jgi:hypothetical protein